MPRERGQRLAQTKATIVAPERGLTPQAHDPIAVAIATALTPVIRNAVADALADFAEAQPPPRALATVEQACAALQVSRATLHKLRLRGLPTIMLLDSPRFDIALCVEWLRQHGAP